jgi:hypothetical protein
MKIGGKVYLRGMKFITKEEFYKLPEGVLYSKWQPQIFDELYIKGSTLYDGATPIDFIDFDLIGNVENKGSDDLFELLYNAEQDLGKPLQEKISLPMDFETGGRDGLFDDDQLFAVYERKDIEGFISALQRSLAVHIEHNF